MKKLIQLLTLISVCLAFTACVQDDYYHCHGHDCHYHDYCHGHDCYHHDNHHHDHHDDHHHHHDH